MLKTKSNVYDTEKETENGYKDIDIETFIQIMKEKRITICNSSFKNKNNNRWYRNSKCVLQNKKLGVYIGQKDVIILQYICHYVVNILLMVVIGMINKKVVLLISGVQ